MKNFFGTSNQDYKKISFSEKNNGGGGGGCTLNKTETLKLTK